MDGVAYIKTAKRTLVYVAPMRGARNMGMLGISALTRAIFSDGFGTIRPKRGLAFLTVWCAAVIKWHEYLLPTQREQNARRDCNQT